MASQWLLLISAVILIPTLAWLALRKSGAVFVADKTPDQPRGWGYKITWIAISTQDPERVLRVLQLENVKVVNWATGLKVAYQLRPKGRVFVTPAIQGHVFLISSSLPDMGHDPERFRKLLSALSREFGQVCYFGSHRGANFVAWARFSDGNELRAFEAAEEISVDRGEKCAAELQLTPSLPHPDYEAPPDEEQLEYPLWLDEDHVLQMARAWSIDPTQIEELDLPASTGWIGKLIDRSP